MTLEERFEHLMKVNAEKDAQLEYLRKQLEQSMRRNRKELRNSNSSSRFQSVAEEEESEGNPFGTSEEDEAREPRRRRGRK